VTDESQLFASAAEIESRKPEKIYGHVYNGRYYLPDAEDPLAWQPGSFGARPFPRGYMRTSNLIGAYSELRGLMMWEEKQILIGLLERPDLYAALSVLPRDKEGQFSYPDSMSITQQAMSAAKADRWSVMGTAYHKALEVRLTSGQLIGTPEIRDGILALEGMLRAALLKPVPSLAERIVVNNTVRVAGRFDVPVMDMREPTEVLRMADLKTKRKRFWSVLEQRAQLAVYAYADAMWDPERMCYVPLPNFDLREGVILHLPQGGGPLDLLRMDLIAGWTTARRAREVVDDRAQAKSEPYLRTLRIPPILLDTPHAVRARFALCETLEEGSAVLMQVKPDVIPLAELDDIVRHTIDRIRENHVVNQLTS
jgi:hypothetical protein